jgi:hypothetical protein
MSQGVPRRRLLELGWLAEVAATPEFFLYGQATLESQV